MIEIRCTKIEQCRNQPALYGKLLALKQALQEGQNGNFNSGMSSKWRSAALTVHHGADIDTAYNNLAFNLGTFSSKACKEKQEPMLDSFTSYFEQLNNNGWQFKYGNKQVSWQGLHDEVKMTGQAPWIMERNGRYHCHYITEKPYPGWQQQLRYPLLQQYIANNILDCDPQLVSIGIYTILDKQFIMMRYAEDELQEAQAEARNIFADVHRAFTRELHTL
ncbi:MAG: hypothetical protein H6550_11600 [Chitinophagales bacterium]|nr:hypothetical protein [Chitinophagales bacterium]